MVRNRLSTSTEPYLSTVQARHLYVHVPFCARRCVYCDFSIAVRPVIPEREFVDAIEREWRMRHVESTLRLDTLYFGGGTPSKLGGGGVARLMDVAARLASISAGAEVTLEANPEDVTTASARAWREAGITRVSLGVQSFHDETLQWMHRTHGAEDARRAVRELRDAGLDNVSIDLIFAVPGHLRREFGADLDAALALELPHISVYGLTVEPQTPLGRWVARADVAEAPEVTFEREYLQAHEALTQSGLEHYEVSNYGQPGRVSRHNLAYWHRDPYVGLGPSAHEFDGTTRRWNTSAYAAWLQRVGNGDDPIGGSERLTDDEASAERLYLSLRTRTGLVLSEPEKDRVSAWIAQGWAALDVESTLRLTAVGWLRLDALASDLTLLRSRY